MAVTICRTETMPDDTIVIDPGGYFIEAADIRPWDSALCCRSGPFKRKESPRTYPQ